MNAVQPFDFKSRTTWATILGVIAGAIGAIHPGFHLSPYVPAFSVLASGAVLAGSIFGHVKGQHHYAAAIDAAAATLPVAAATIPGGATLYESRLRQLETFVQGVQTAIQGPPSS